MNVTQDELRFWYLASEVSLHAHTKGKSISKETYESVKGIYNAARKSFDETVDALMSGTYKAKENADT